MNQYKTSEQQRAAARLYYHTNIKNNPHKMYRERLASGNIAILGIRAPQYSNN